MNLPAALYAVRWLIHDTFRQAMASGIFWVMMTVSAVCIGLCLSISVDGPLRMDVTDVDPEFLPRGGGGFDAGKVQKSGLPQVTGNLHLAFGAFPVPLGRDARDSLRFLQLMMAAGVADTLGVLLTLVWTAGFLPTFLEPSAASVLLAKPVPRWSLLVGKYLGVLTFVALQALVFVGGTWLAIGFRTGLWDLPYLLAIPMLLLNFSVFFSFSALLAVLSRSTVVCVFGSLVFWLMCWGMNFGRHTVFGLQDFQDLSSFFRFLLDVGYWVMPKPGDMSLLLYDALDSTRFLSKPLALKNVQEQGMFSPELSLVSMLIFAVIMVALAGYEFMSQDY